VLEVFFYGVYEDLGLNVFACDVHVVVLMWKVGGLHVNTALYVEIVEHFVNNVKGRFNVCNEVIFVESFVPIYSTNYIDANFVKHMRFLLVVHFCRAYDDPTDSVFIRNPEVAIRPNRAMDFFYLHAKRKFVKRFLQGGANRFRFFDALAIVDLICKPDKNVNVVVHTSSSSWSRRFPEWALHPNRTRPVKPHRKKRG
jgi:hypothetical protein